jgi:hypothetical protein
MPLAFSHMSIHILANCSCHFYSTHFCRTFVGGRIISFQNMLEWVLRFLSVIDIWRSFTVCEWIRKRRPEALVCYSLLWIKKYILMKRKMRHYHADLYAIITHDFFVIFVRCTLLRWRVKWSSFILMVMGTRPVRNTAQVFLQKWLTMILRSFSVLVSL